MTGSTLPATGGLADRPLQGCQDRTDRDARRPGRLSHDFGTPLNAVLGNVELMLAGATGPLSAEAHACLAEIQSAGQDLARQSRALLLLVQALETDELDEERLALGPMFLDAMRQAQIASPDERLIASRAVAATRLVGDGFWLRHLAGCVVDIYASAGAEEPLRISTRSPGRLRFDWPSSERDDVPVTMLRLMGRIMQMHGGQMFASTGGSLVLCWPAARLLPAE
jgi:signal transduction histidine kinase